MANLLEKAKYLIIAMIVLDVILLLVPFGVPLSKATYGFLADVSVLLQDVIILAVVMYFLKKK
jgi:hypothetical protein